MPACAILGDSLAAGVALYRPACTADTRVGITSEAYVSSHVMAVAVDKVIISLGANDGPPTSATVEHLLRLRRGIRARTVYWILPARPEVTRILIRSIARLNGDRLIETQGFTGPDGLHLTGRAYREIGDIFDLPPIR